MKPKKQVGFRQEPEHKEAPRDPGAPLEEATGPGAQTAEHGWHWSVLERAAVPGPEARTIRDWGINE